MGERFAKGVLLFLGIALLGLFFLFKHLGADIGNVYWRFSLLRMHLASEWSIPYFTPGRCGGFLLAADSHDLLFSLYTFVSFLIPNIDWAIRISNFLLSFVLVGGVYVWLKYFGVTNSLARLFSSLLVALSGYWICHMSTGGHVWAHGLAYTPWIMVAIEELLQRPVGRERRYWVLWMSLAGLFFLLINSGYYWLQVAVPMIGFRILVECLFSVGWERGRLKQVGIVLLAGAFAILLSLPRLAGIYEFQLSKFPRGGGEIPHFQIIGNTWALISLLFRAFFDGNIIAKGIHQSGSLCFYWDYANFIGLAALVPMVVGLLRTKKLLKSRIFISLLLAVLFQLALIRTARVADTIRFLVPFYKSITWYWRGNGILTLFAVVLIASGYESILRLRHKVFLFLALALMLFNLGEIAHAHLPQIVFRPGFFVFDPMCDPDPPTHPLKNHYALCDLGHIFGYGNEYPPQISLNCGNASGGMKGSIYEAASPDVYYDMHDVRQLAGPQAQGGYYLTHPWPLWPRADSAEFERFINYKQVIPLPMRLRVMNLVGAFAWTAYAVFFSWLMIMGRKKK